MIVKLYRNETELEVRVALYNRALSVIFDSNFVGFEVKTWRDFLSLYWKACADITRHEHWRLALRKRHVVIVMDDGRIFSSWVEMRMDDEQEWGLWYESTMEE